MKKILFIGNSYTYVNDLPTVFASIADAAGVAVSVSSVTKGGWTLEKHASPADECGARVEEAFAKNAYDYVILQEQSYRPLVHFDRFCAAAENLSARARANGAMPILYATWGRGEGCPLLEEHGWTNTTMTDGLADAYAKVGAAFDIPVAHFGRAYYEVYTGSTVELYHADLSHPAPAGTYLAALTLFAKMFGTDPTRIPFTPAFLSADADMLLKLAAKNAV